MASIPQSLWATGRLASGLLWRDQRLAAEVAAAATASMRQLSNAGVESFTWNSITRACQPGRMQAAAGELQTSLSPVLPRRELHCRAGEAITHRQHRLSRARTDRPRERPTSCSKGIHQGAYLQPIRTGV